MTQVIVYTNDNGGVAVCAPTGEISISAVMGKDIPAGKQAYIVEDKDLPNDANDFFDAWEQVNGKVSVSLAKAKNITKNRLRAERQPLLAAQDVLFQRALEEGSDTAAIVAEKNRLRDVTKAADTCETLDELRALKAAKD